MRLLSVIAATAAGAMIAAPGWTIATYVGFAIYVVVIFFATLGDLSE